MPSRRLIICFRSLSMQSGRKSITGLRRQERRPSLGIFLSPLTFENAFQTWSTQRFRPNGNSTDRLVFVVTESSIQEKDLTLDTGISAVFKKQQAFEYTVVLDVTIQLVSPDDRVKSEANVRTRQTRTAGEEATISDKKVIWSEMIARLVNQMDEELRPKLRQYFSDSMRL